MINLENLVKDISDNKEHSQYINIIKKDYPYLLGILKNDNMIFNPNFNKLTKIGAALEKKDYYCPCVLNKNEDTLCPCKKMREENNCICGLYINK